MNNNSSFLRSADIFSSVEVHCIKKFEDGQLKFKFWQPKSEHTQFSIYQELRRIHTHLGASSPFTSEEHALVFMMPPDRNMQEGVSVLARLDILKLPNASGLVVCFSNVLNLFYHEHIFDTIVDDSVREEYSTFVCKHINQSFPFHPSKNSNTDVSYSTKPRPVISSLPSATTGFSFSS